MSDVLGIRPMPINGEQPKPYLETGGQFEPSSGGTLGFAFIVLHNIPVQDVNMVIDNVTALIVENRDKLGVQINMEPRAFSPGSRQQ